MTKRALIVDPAFLGDVVFDGPLARALKNDGYEVGIVVRPPQDVLAGRMTHIDHVHVFDKRGRDGGWSGLARVAKTIAAGRYELALVVHPSPRSAMLASRTKIPRRIGAATGTFSKMWLTERVTIGSGRTFVEERLALYAPNADASLAGVVERRTPPQTNALPRLGLVLGSEWATKRWPVERAKALVSSLEDRVRFVWIGAPWETALYAELGDAEDRTQGDVADLIDAIESCDAVVGGDTGPLHVARAMGIPVIALFGPTSETRHDFEAVDRVLVEAMTCRPCSPHGGKVCPLGHHRCLADLAGERVAGSAVEALRRT